MDVLGILKLRFVVVAPVTECLEEDTRLIPSLWGENEAENEGSTLADSGFGQ